LTAVYLLKRVTVQFDGPGMEAVERGVIERRDADLDERARCPRCGALCWACVRGVCPRCEAMHL
jgi:hypothetical protein